MSLTGTLRQPSGQYRLRLVESGNAGKETPLNTEGWMRRTLTPSGKDDLYLARLNKDYDRY